MPVPVDPYTFVDGPGNTASGVQVNQRFNALYGALNPAVTGLDYQNVQNNGLREINMATGANGLAKGAFSAYRAGTQSIATGAGTVIVFDTEEFDVSGWFDTATGRYTPQVPGYYRLSANVASSAVQAVDVAWAPVLRKNGSSYKNLPNNAQRNGATPISAGGSVIAVANGTTDYFEVLHTHTAASATLIAGGAALTYFQGELIGRS